MDPALPKTEHQAGNDREAAWRPYYEIGQAFLERHKDVFFALAKDRSLKFKIGKGFHINLEKGEIVLDVADFKSFKEKGLTEWQIVWSVCHEIAHYLDLRQDPKGMLENFEYIKRKARELAPKVVAIWTEKWGAVPPHMLGVPGSDKGLTGVEAFVYEQLRRNVYNALDDIYVNRLVEQFAAPFAPDGSQRHQTELLYRDHLFPTDPSKPGQPPMSDVDPADYAGLPKSSQLCDALLRRAMVPGQAVLVSDEVRDIHKSFRSEAARRFGLTVEREVLEQATNPVTKRSKTATTRYQYYRELVEPRFLELFLKDMETLPPPKPRKETEPGAQSDQEDESDPWNLPSERTPNPIDENTVKDFVKQQKDKARKDKEDKEKENRTPEQRAADEQRRKDDALCAEKGMDPQAAREYREIQSSVGEHIKGVSEVFEGFIRDIERRISESWMEGFRSGKFNTKRFVKKYGHYLTEGGEQFVPWSTLDAYDRREYVSRLKLKPSRFRVRLVLDGSGSMEEDKLKALKKVFVLLSESLAWFEATMNLRFKLKQPFVVDTEVHMFGSRTEKVKSFAQGKPTSEEELADRFLAFSKINNGWGGTYDCLPLQNINASIDADYQKELADGTTKEILVEITDGGTQTKPQTIIEIDALQSKHVTTKALLIGSAEGTLDANTFAETWGEKGARVDDVSQLASVMAKLLSGEISKVKARIRYQGEDLEDDEDEAMDRVKTRITGSNSDQDEAMRLRAAISVADNPFKPPHA